MNTALERHTLFLDFVFGGTGHCLASGSVRALSRSGLLITELPLFVYLGQVGELGLPTLGLVQQPAHGALGVTLVAKLRTRLFIVAAKTVEGDLELVNAGNLGSGTLSFRCEDGSR